MNEQEVCKAKNCKNRQGTVDRQLNNNSTHVLFNIRWSDIEKNKIQWVWKLNGTKVNWGCLKGRDDWRQSRFWWQTQIQTHRLPRDTECIDSTVGRSVVTHSMLISIATQVDDVCNDYYWMSGFFLFEIMIMSL